MFPQFGGLEINTSSTALQALTDAVLYLYDYRYDSADGYASRIMAVAALRDVLDAFDADGLPDAATSTPRSPRHRRSSQPLQNDDGGFPYWQRGRHVDPVAVDAGDPRPACSPSKRATRRPCRHPRAGRSTTCARIEEFIPADYGEQVRDTLSAYALYVRTCGRGAPTRRRRPSSTDGRATTSNSTRSRGCGRRSTTTELRTEIERRFQNTAVETAGAATFATSYGEDAYVIAHSDRQTDGIILDALLTETPGSDLIPKVVAGLLGNQTRGRWNNAHENAFILLALNRYFDTFEVGHPRLRRPGLAR